MAKTWRPKPAPAPKKREPRKFEKALLTPDLYFRAILRPLEAIVAGNLPWKPLVSASVAFFIIFSLGFDYYIFRWNALLDSIYPTSDKFRFIYFSFFIFMPFYSWGLVKIIEEKRFEERFLAILAQTGIRSDLFKFKIFNHYSVDAEQTKIVISNLGFPQSKFEQEKLSLEAGLRVRIADIKENISRGQVEIIYTTTELPEKLSMNEVPSLRHLEFVVGKTRSKEIHGVFGKIAHLLVAGQSGMGKSTFLRQLITTLYLKNKDIRFYLFDFKDGTEMSLFNDLPRIKICDSVESAEPILASIKKEMHKRSEIFKATKVKDLEGYNSLPEDKLYIDEKARLRVRLNPWIIVLDEIADLYFQQRTKNQAIERSRLILDELARKARSTGIHLILGTQRPDAKSLDPRVKANMSATLCFYVESDTSSLVVLDSGRASKLPRIAGRAIWKEGNTMTELQVPHMTSDLCVKLLEPFQKEKEQLKDEIVAEISEVNSSKNSQVISLTSNKNKIIGAEV